MGLIFLDRENAEKFVHSNFKKTPKGRENKIDCGDQGLAELQVLGTLV